MPTLPHSIQAGDPTQDKHLFPARRTRAPVFLFAALLLALVNMGPLAMAAISAYQRIVSPALGIHCGYAQAMRAESCSAFTKRVLAENGFWRGLPRSLQRFRACAQVGKGNAP